MCDYSLHGIRNRLAEEGEVLVVHRFFTGSKGLTSPEYLKPTAQPRGLLTALKKFFAVEPQIITAEIQILLAGSKAPSPDEAKAIVLDFVASKLKAVLATKC